MLLRSPCCEAYRLAPTSPRPAPPSFHKKVIAGAKRRNMPRRSAPPHPTNGYKGRSGQPENPREKTRRRPIPTPVRAGRGDADPIARPAPPSFHKKVIAGAKRRRPLRPGARPPRQRGCVARLAAPNNLKNRRLKSAPASRARVRLGNIGYRAPFSDVIQCVAIGQSAGARKPSVSTSEGHGRAVAIALLRSLPPSSDVAAASAAVIS